MKKITLLTLFALCSQVNYSQINFSENYDNGIPTVGILNDGYGGFYDDTDFICNPTNPSIYTNLYNSSQGIARVTTPALTTQQQLTTVITFKYNIIDSNTEAPFVGDWGTIDIKYTLKDPNQWTTTWTTVKTLTYTDLPSQSSCVGYKLQLPATAFPSNEDILIMFEWKWKNGDWIFFFDDLSIYQSTASLPNFDKNHLKVYPNPVKDNLSISYNKTITNYSIYDLTGRLIKNETNSSENLTINLEQLNQGTYLLKLNTSTENEVIKFIKE